MGKVKSFGIWEVFLIFLVLVGDFKGFDMDFKGFENFFCQL